MVYFNDNFDVCWKVPGIVHTHHHRSSASMRHWWAFVADVYSTSTFHPSQTGMASTFQFLCNQLQVYLAKEGKSPEQLQGARVVSDLATLVYGSATLPLTISSRRTHWPSSCVDKTWHCCAPWEKCARSSQVNSYWRSTHRMCVRVRLRFHRGHHISYAPKTNKTIVEPAQTTSNLCPPTGGMGLKGLHYWESCRDYSDGKENWPFLSPRTVNSVRI